MVAVFDPNIERFLRVRSGLGLFVVKGMEEAEKDRDALFVPRTVNDRVNRLRAKSSVIPNLDTPSFRETSVTYHRSETAGC